MTPRRSCYTILDCRSKGNTIPPLGRTQRAENFGASARSARLPRQHLDLAVDAGDDLKVALIGLARVARDEVIIALGEHDAGKGADRFLDDVAAGGEHRPLGI